MAWHRGEVAFIDVQHMLSRLREKAALFGGLTDQDLLLILQGAEKREFKAGDTIIKQGSSSRYLYVVVSGEAMVSTKDEADLTDRFLLLQPGDSFGEMALIDGEERCATVSATQDSLMFRIGEIDCDHYPKVGLKIYRNIAAILAGHIRRMNKRRRKADPEQLAVVPMRKQDA